jgi:WD40 repeat protein
LNVRSIDFSPDGKTVAFGRLGEYSRQGTVPGAILLVDAQRGEAKGQLTRKRGYHMYSPMRIRFSPDGSALAAVAGSGEVDLWNVDRSTVARTLTDDEQGDVRDLAFSPDGKTLATLSQDGKYIRLWDAERGSKQQQISTDGRLTRLAYSPDGKSLATASYVRDAGLMVWDLRTGKPRAQLFTSQREGNRLRVLLARWTDPAGPATRSRSDCLTTPQLAAHNAIRSRLKSLSGMNLRWVAIGLTA